MPDFDKDKPLEAPAAEPATAEVTREELPEDVEKAIDEHIRVVANRPHALKCFIGDQKPFKKGFDVVNAARESVVKQVLGHYDLVGRPALARGTPFGLKLLVKEAFLIGLYDKDEPAEFTAVSQFDGAAEKGPLQDVADTVRRAFDMLSNWTPQIQAEMQDGRSYKAQLVAKWAWPDVGGDVVPQ